MPAMIPTEQLLPRLALARDVADAAGAITLRYFQTHRFEVIAKPDGSPVTTADREAEQEIRRLVETRFPADGVLGEEFGERAGSSGFRWIIDPIDGTASFIAGVPLFGTIVGVEHRDPGKGARACIVGVVHIPALKETVSAATGAGCSYRGPDGSVRPARVSAAPTPAQARFLTSSLDYFRTDDRRALFLELCRAFRSERGWGDCYAHVLVATGRADACVDPILNPWDIAGVIPVIQEAGGRWTDWAGNVDHLSGTGIATNGLIHDATLALVRGR
jgi:histidinol phosphatase-like enzyme (inositol monophosphatase family)